MQTPEVHTHVHVLVAVNLPQHIKLEPAAHAQGEEPLHQTLECMYMLTSYFPVYQVL